MKYNYPEKISLFTFLWNANALTRNPIPFHRRFFNAYNDSFTVANSRKRKIFLTRDAAIAKQVLQQKHRKYEKSEIQTRFLSKYVGYGLLTSNGDYWIKQRRLIQPAFHKRKLEKLISIMNEAIIEELNQIPTNKFVDIYEYMNQLAFNVVAKSLFSFAANKEMLSRLQYIIAELQQFIVKELRQPHKRWWFNLSGQVKSKLKLSEESRQIILSVIEHRRSSGESHDDLLDMLLNAVYEDDGSKMTNEQLIDEILILFVAGHETTANALTFAIHKLSNRGDVFEKIEQESKTITDFTSTESLMRLSYTKAVIDEIMRLYPPAWITDRVAIEDDDLGDYKIQKGAILGVSIYEIHRSSKHWESPEEFRPERFLGDQAKLHKDYYYPFGAGPRMCIGNNFAIYEMMITLAKITAMFDLESNGTPIKVNPLITLKPVNALVKFIKK